MKGGNKFAFNEIYERYWKKLFLTIYKRIKSQDDAKDIVQDLFASIWIKRDMIEVRYSLSAYLVSAIKYKLINYIESNIVRRNYLTLLSKTIEDYDNTTDERIQGKDLQESLQSGLKKLSPKVKEVFELSRNENLSIKEIAAKLNSSEQTVKNQISKALKTLKIHLNQFLSLILLITQI